jgi:hypothetical protein
MRSTWWRGGLAAAIVLSVPVAVSAQNTSAAMAAHLLIGQTPSTFSLSDATTERWFDIVPVAGRSYCVEVTTAYTEGEVGHPAVTVYRPDGTTVLAPNQDTTVGEPGAVNQARACWIQPTGAGATALLKVTDSIAAKTVAYDLRAVETTQYCDWFFVAGDYNAFSLLRNTTNASVAVAVTWRGLDGTVVGSLGATLAANATLAVNGRTYVTGATSGSVEVAHDGSPEAIQGSTTTLSGTLGVGFDALFTARRPW